MKGFSGMRMLAIGSTATILPSAAMLHGPHCDIDVTGDNGAVLCNRMEQPHSDAHGHLITGDQPCTTLR
jgi:hypothetical protein